MALRLPSGHLAEVAHLRPLPSTVGRVPLGDATVDLELREVRRGEQVERLTPIEAEALAYLVERAGTVVTRDALLRDVWGYADGVESHTVAVCMRRLRAKLEADPKAPEFLRTVRGVGWTLQLDESASAEPVDDLPRYRTRWVGRERLEALVEALSGSRQLTLWGPAGIGKSRAAVELARHLDGAVERRHASLGDAETPAIVVARVAAALDVPCPAGDVEAAAERIAEVLGARPATVLVLDECERHLDTLVPLVVAHGSQPRPAWLVLTSRRRLGTDGERVHELPPLSSDDGAQLFSGLAALRDASYDDRAERRHVDGIVHAVQGNPLALELAAARLDLEDPATLAAELSHDPSVGVGRSVRRSIDALPPESAAVLQQLAVFVGGFDARDVRGVVESDHAIGALRSLIDAALVQRRTLPSGVRLSLHTAVREALASRPPGDDVVARHAAWFAARATALRPEIGRDPGARRWLHDAADELVAALRVSLHEPERGEALAWAVNSCGGRRGPAWLAGELDRLLAARPDPTLAARLRRYRASAWMRLGRLEKAEAELKALLADAETPETRASIAHGLGMILGVLRGDRAAGEQWFRRGLDAGPSPRTRAALHNGLGLLAAQREELQRARDHFERAVQALHEVGDALQASRILMNLSGVRMRLGDGAGAVAACVEAGENAERFDDAVSVCSARLGLGCLTLELGRHREARGALSQALGLARRAADRIHEGVALCVLGWLDAEIGQLERGRRRMADSLRVLERTGHRGHISASETAAVMLAWAAGDLAEVEARLRARLAGPPDLPTVRTVQAALLGCLLTRQDRADEARRWREEARMHPAGEAASQLLDGETVEAPPLPAFEVRMLERLAGG